MIWLILGLVLFLGMHSVRMLAPDFRSNFIAQRGENAWKGLYSVVSIVGFVLIVWGYGMARGEGPVLYVLPFWFKHITLLLMLVAFVLLATAYVPSGRIKSAIKHPMLLVVKLWAYGHLLSNGDLVSVLLFGGFLVWAICDRISESRRERVGMTTPPEPGPVSNDAIAVVIGVVAYVLFVWKLHEWLIGVSPIVI